MFIFVFVFTGHFIIVCGYSVKDKLIYYHNPSYKQSKLPCFHYCTDSNCQRAYIIVSCQSLMAVTLDAHLAEVASHRCNLAIV